MINKKLVSLLLKMKINDDDLKVFEEASKELLNPDFESKGKLIDLIIDVIYQNGEVEEKLTKLPNLIQELFFSFQKLHYLSIRFEQIELFEFSFPEQFKIIVIDYYDYLEDSKNNMYINNSANALSFNKRLLEYATKYKESISDELFLMVEKINKKNQVLS